MLRNVGVVLVKFVIIDLLVFLLILPCVRSLFVFFDVVFNSFGSFFRTLFFILHLIL